MIYGIGLLVLWIYMLTVLRRGRLGFYHFLLGSVGTFVLLMGLVPFVKEWFIHGFVWALGVLGNITGLYESYAQHGMFFINRSDVVMSLYVDLECSGIIEMLVYVSLLVFFPVYRWREKVRTGIVGLLCICAFNFIRIYVIIAMIISFGASVYSLAHAIVGRIVFYVLTVVLYFHVFTRGQITRQKVGRFGYVDVDDKQ